MNDCLFIGIFTPCRHFGYIHEGRKFVWCFVSLSMFKHVFGLDQPEKTHTKRVEDKITERTQTAPELNCCLPIKVFCFVSFFKCHRRISMSTGKCSVLIHKLKLVLHFHYKSIQATNISLQMEPTHTRFFISTTVSVICVWVRGRWGMYSHQRWQIHYCAAWAILSNFSLEWHPKFMK